VVAYDAVWAIGGNGVARVDPATSAVISIPVAQTGTTTGPNLTALAAGAGAIWAASRYISSSAFSEPKKPGTVYRIDPRTNAVTTAISVGTEPFAIAAADDALWVTSRTDRQVWRIDPKTNRVVTKIDVGGIPTGLVADGDAVWVAVS
jgi:YVTN family beta-propeller protein